MPPVLCEGETALFVQIYNAVKIHNVHRTRPVLHMYDQYMYVFQLTVNLLHVRPETEINIQNPLCNFQEC